jgi:HSP20 family molecular chaperone IbpA
MSTLLQRVEGYMAGGRYVVHAELSGSDLEKDIQVTVGPGYLTIKADGAEESTGTPRAEFCCGSFTRTVPLPAEADGDDVTAGCDHGILTVSIGLKTPE